MQVKKQQLELDAFQCRRHGFDPWVGRSPGEGNGNPLQYSCLENPMGEEPEGLHTVHRVVDKLDPIEETRHLVARTQSHDMPKGKRV